MSEIQILKSKFKLAYDEQNKTQQLLSKLLTNLVS